MYRESYKHMKSYENVVIPEAFTASSTTGKPKLTADQVGDTFVANLKKLSDFYAGKSVKFAELKYGRETEVKLGIEQVIPNKGKAKLVGVKFAGHNEKDDDVRVLVNGEEKICVNLTGLWKIGENSAVHQYSIFAGKI